MQIRSFWQLLIVFTALSIGATFQAQGTPLFNLLPLEGVEMENPTALQFGPDGRLYISELNGLIRILEVEATDDNYYVTSEETIDLIQSIPNYNDDGTRRNETGRQVTGMLVTGTSDDPVIYVSSSDDRVFFFYMGVANESEYLNQLPDTNSGIISRLQQATDGWQRTDLVRGLPRSINNHSTNGLALDPTSQILYVAQGGNTNMGAPNSNTERQPEYAYTAAVLSIDLAQIGNESYDLPTLDPPTDPTADNYNTPFGGRMGANQAIIDPQGPVQLYATGLRNPYDLLIASVGDRAGNLYTFDNGANIGWGGPPVIENGICRN